MLKLPDPPPPPYGQMEVQHSPNPLQKNVFFFSCAKL